MKVTCFGLKKPIGLVEKYFGLLQPETDSGPLPNISDGVFTKTGNRFKLYTNIFIKSFILNIERGPGCISGCRYIITIVINT